MRDEEIIELYWQRSEDAIRATAAKYGGYCGSIAVNILSDRRDAEEGLHDTRAAARTALPPPPPQRLGLFLGESTPTAGLDCPRAPVAL